MKLLWFRRALALALVCFLLPLAALGESITVPEAETEATEEAMSEDAAAVEDAVDGETADGAETSPADAWPVDDPSVTRATFSLGLHLNASAFPPDGQTDFQGWQQFLDKLSLTGTIDTQRFLRPIDRAYFEGALNLNGRPVLPFTYEGYHSYRYVRSPALDNRSIHFQMNNFFEFMFKPYYYMGLPTNYLALLLYPEAASYLVENYEDPLADCLTGTGNRVVPYAELYELCETLDQIAADDPDYQHVWYYVNALLIDLQVSDSTYDSLCSWETLLDFLDPEQNGMGITVQGDTETYTLGSTVIFTRTLGQNDQSFVMTLPNDQGYTLTVSGLMADSASGGRDGHLRVQVALENETRIDLKADATGLPREQDTQAMGNVRFTLGGTAFSGADTACSFAFRLTRSAAEPPYEVTLGLDWIHPVTEEAAITLLYKAGVQMMDETALKDREYDNQNDFFHLNEGFLEEYKHDFLLPLTLAFTPIVLEMPGGVVNDILRFCDTTGLLASLGIE